jgi:hypothetical protein
MDGENLGPLESVGKVHEKKSSNWQVRENCIAL